MAAHTFLLFLFALPNFVGAACNDPSNVCGLDDAIYTPANGYDCFQTSNQEQFKCTCYGNHFTINEPCRCRTAQVCGTGTNVVGCIDLGNAEYVCVCQDGDSHEFNKDKPCGNATTVSVVTSKASTSTQTTTQRTIPDIDKVEYCANGIHDSEMQFCHCLSGFSGRHCEKFDLERVCDRIVCKNGGACVYGYENGVHYSRCVCPLGFEGEYCEQETIRGSCRDPTNYNICRGYPCSESMKSDGQNYLKCVTCPQTTYGALCDRHVNIPKCSRRHEKLFDPYMHEQGKYFQCGEFIRGYAAVYRESCPKGLRYNLSKNLCVLPEYE